jgi:hypothetical protein
VLISLLGTRGKKDENHSVKQVMIIAILGLILFYASTSILSMHGTIYSIETFYMVMCSVGFALVQGVRTIVTDNLPRRNSDAKFPGIGEGNVLSRNVFLLMDDIFCNFQI